MDKDRLLGDVKQAEGFRDKPYKDTRGFWTGGYGHFLTPQDDATWQAFLDAGHRFDASTIANWLSTDLDKAASYAQTLLEWNSMDCAPRQNALIELVYNMGLTTWKLFAYTRACMSHKQWDMAYNGLLNSKWAREVQPDGFDKPGRATRIADYIRNGRFE